MYVIVIYVINYTSAHSSVESARKETEDYYYYYYHHHHYHYHHPCYHIYVGYFTIVYLKQTMFLRYIVLQLFCIYSLGYM